MSSYFSRMTVPVSLLKQVYLLFSEVIYRLIPPGCSFGFAYCWEAYFGPTAHVYLKMGLMTLLMGVVAYVLYEKRITPYKEWSEDLRRDCKYLEEILELMNNPRGTHEILQEILQEIRTPPQDNKH